MSTQSAIRPALAAISVMVSRPTSGRPISAAEVPNPVMYTAGNPASSTSRAASGSNAPGATIVGPDSSSARSRAAPPGRRVSRPVTGHLAPAAPPAPSPVRWSRPSAPPPALFGMASVIPAGGLPALHGGVVLAGLPPPQQHDRRQADNPGDNAGHDGCDQDDLPRRRDGVHDDADADQDQQQAQAVDPEEDG